MRAGILQASDLGLDSVHQLFDDTLLFGFTVKVNDFILGLSDLAMGNFDLLFQSVEILDFGLDILAALLKILGLFLRGGKTRGTVGRKWVRDAYSYIIEQNS